MDNAKTLTSKNPDETFGLGVSLGKILTGGDVITLSGELGSGKTWLTKGIALGLGVRDADSVTSPSYTLINEYQGRLPLFHMDFYRLQDQKMPLDLGLEEYLYGSGVTVIEWPEPLAGLLPSERLEVHLFFVAEKERKIVFIPHGEAWTRRIEKFVSSPIH